MTVTYTLPTPQPLSGSQAAAVASALQRLNATQSGGLTVQLTVSVTVYLISWTADAVYGRISGLRAAFSPGSAFLAAAGGSPTGSPPQPQGLAHTPYSAWPYPTTRGDGLAIAGVVTASLPMLFAYVPVVSLQAWTLALAADFGGGLFLGPPSPGTLALSVTSYSLSGTAALPLHSVASVAPALAAAVGVDARGITVQASSPAPPAPAAPTHTGRARPPVSSRVKRH